MTNNANPTSYGVTLRLPPHDPLAKPHLLGPDWSKTHWFATAEEREHFIRDLSSQHIYYRIDDIPDFNYQRIEQAAS